MIAAPAPPPAATAVRAHRRGRPPAVLLCACAWALTALGLPGGPAANAQGLDLGGARAQTGQAGHARLLQPAPPGTAQQAPAEPVSVKAQTTAFIIGAAALATVGAFQSKLAPDACRWCDLHPDGTDALNGLDTAARNAWVWQDPNTASRISDVIAYGVVPAVALGADAWAARAAGQGGNFKVDALVIGESVLAAAGAAEILKFATARLRPYAHARTLGQPTDVPAQSSDNMSFTSGHTAVVFAMTVSAARVMTLRRYGHAGWVWGLGLPAAAAVGYFRIAADRHYLTDVLGAAGVGTAMGLIVPRLAFATRSAGTKRVAIVPQFAGPYFGVTCTW